MNEPGEYLARMASGEQKKASEHDDNTYGEYQLEKQRATMYVRTTYIVYLLHSLEPTKICASFEAEVSKFICSRGLAWV